MKLQVQYNKISIASTVLVLVIAGAGYYFLLQYVLKEQLDETLRVEQVEIQDFIQTHHSLPPATTYKDQRIEFKKTDKALPQSFRTLTLYDHEEKENELSRQLDFTVEVNGEYYIASVTKSQEATEEIICVILLITLGLIILLSMLLFFANRFVVKRLWKPFQTTLSSIKSFDLNAPSAIKAEKTTIHEFNELNENISSMTEKVVKDYLSLKHFIDHASHEMQTPLAVINSKLDVLIQDPSLNEKNLQDLQVIYDAVDKMSKLSQSLLLLARIENNQFSEKQEVDINIIAKNIIQELDEWISERSLTVSNKINDLKVNMNPQLANTLITNLIINAIKHSSRQENILLRSERNILRISNPGTRALNGDKIFDRFWKSEYSDGTGLGLAIAKQICDHYGFLLQYEFREGTHHFSIFF
ncbi:MAG TPA: HAMP domain-containing sensor histidine kinase [Chitinophagaceae bacterium]|nr:HAMP domain-containing sensor histidine kinase [Chitinophagaceae bacterium]